MSAIIATYATTAGKLISEEGGDVSVRMRSSMGSEIFLGLERIRPGWSYAASVGAVLLLLSSALAFSQESVDPLGAASPPKKVEIGVFVLDVFTMDSVDQTTSVDFIVRARWHDASLAGGSDGPRFVKLENLWTPELQVLNSRDLRTVVNNSALVMPDGSVTYRERHIGEVTTRLDLTDFPFDQHRIGIAVASTALQRVELKIEEDWSGMAETLTIADWEVGMGKIGIAPVSAGGRTFSSVVYEMGAVRHTGYWIWKVMFPLLLIVGMSWTVFWINPSDIGPQVGTATASMLTLIAYRFALGNLLPRVSYFTGMDSFVTGSTLVVFLALLVAILTSKLATSGRAELAGKIDVVCRVMFPATFVGVITYSFSL